MPARLAALVAVFALSAAALSAADPPLPQPKHCGHHEGYGTYRVNDIYERSVGCDTAIKVAEGWLGNSACQGVGYCHVHDNQWSCHNTYYKDNPERRATCAKIGGSIGINVYLYWIRRQ